MFGACTSHRFANDQVPRVLGKCISLCLPDLCTTQRCLDEALGEISAANKSYRSLKEEPEMNEEDDYDEAEDPLQFFSTEIVPNGSIDERIQRTGGN